VPKADASIEVHSLKVTADGVAERERVIPQEVPVALVYDGTTYAVMMASPSDLEDFAIGFSLAEGIVAAADEIEGLDVQEQENGIELRMWLAPHRRRDLAERRRRMAGPTGCGLCGVESLEAALPACPRVTAELTITADDVATALAALEPAQALNRKTRAVHGAGFWTRAEGLVALAEDVGRHNALDKLIGARLLAGELPLSDSVLFLSGRASFELLQKAAAAGIPVVAAVGAPSSLAIDLAQRTGIMLVGFLRGRSFNVYAHRERLQ